MTRLSELGGGFGQLAPQSLEYQGLEPTGLPAYEGTGYPAAGFGERRNRVVKFNPKRVGRITIDPINRYSDVNTRAQVSVLGSLGGHGDEYHGGHCRSAMRGLLSDIGDFRTDGSAIDRSFLVNLKALAGIGSLGLDIPSPVQLADMIAKGVMPQALIDAVTNKVVKDQAAVDKFYVNIQKIKALPKAKQPADLDKLAAEQGDAWGKLNTIKYYLLMLTDFQKSLGFAAGKPKVTPPDYNYIKRKASSGDPGFLERTAQRIKDKLFREKTAELIKKKYYTGTLDGVALRGIDGLGDFGATALVITGAVAAVIIAYLGADLVKSDPARRAAALAVEQAETKIVKAKAKLQQAKTPAEAEDARKEIDAAVKGAEASAEKGGRGGVGDIAKYAAYAVGGIVLIYALGLFKPKG